MSQLTLEHHFNCPYCGAAISVILDLSQRAEDYVEDCEVCCQPMRVAYATDDAELSWFRVDRLD
jgi:transcription elongation factor Elf1